MHHLSFSHLATFQWHNIVFVVAICNRRSNKCWCCCVHWSERYNYCILYLQDDNEFSSCLRLAIHKRKYMYQQDKSHSLLFFRVALHIHICMYQQDKMSSWPKGPASDPMHTRDHWLDQSFKYIYLYHGGSWSSVRSDI